MKKRICCLILLLGFSFIILIGCSNGNLHDLDQTTPTIQSNEGEISDFKSTWESVDTLPDHFDRHRADFGAKSEEEYAKMAHVFFENRAMYSVKVDTDGIIRVYDSKTDTFGSYNPDGKTKTFFKPNSPGYWSRQPGKLMGGK